MRMLRYVLDRVLFAATAYLAFVTLVFAAVWVVTAPASIDAGGCYLGIGLPLLR